MPRPGKEFSKKVKVQAFERAKGRCEGCGAFLVHGKYHYDHDLPAEFNGPGTLSNCRVLCLGCHREKTGKVDVPAIAKSNRVRAKHAGIKKQRGRPIPGSKASGWKQKINGEWVKR